MPRPMEDYVEVAERIERFYEKYPEGSLRCKETRIETVAGNTFLVYVAQAMRTPDDAAPAEGSAWEPVPGKTNFTRDSELMNAETSAWGRAIAALGFEVKRGIASRQEVMNRRDADLGGGKPQSQSIDPGAAAEASDADVGGGLEVSRTSREPGTNPPAADVSAEPPHGKARQEGRSENWADGVSTLARTMPGGDLALPPVASPQLKAKATQLMNKAGLAKEARQAVIMLRCGTLSDPPRDRLQSLVTDLEQGATHDTLLAEIHDAARAGLPLGKRAAAMIPTDVPNAEPPPEPEAPDGDDIPF